MNRVESWLRRTCWPIPVMRVMLFGLLLFWVFPTTWVASQFADTFRQDAAMARKYPQTRERQLAATRLGDDMLKRAENLGKDYGPQHYFQDLKNVQNASWGVISPQTQIMAAQQVMMVNFQKGRFTEGDLEHWRETVSPPAKKYPPIDWAKVFWWIAGHYLRLQLLVLLAYLLRMVDFQGILRTILADKREFLHALFDWPHHFWDYPRYTIREVQVEAEIRRIGDAFRRLNPVERLKIREIASAENFKERLRALHETNRPYHRRGLLVAMLATLICLLILPKVSEASAKVKTNLYGAVVATARAGPTVTLSLASDFHPTLGGEGNADFLAASELLILQSEPATCWEETPPRQEVFRRIDHIPEVSLSVPVVILTGARQGEINDEDRIRRTAVRRAA